MAGEKKDSTELRGGTEGCWKNVRCGKKRELNRMKRGIEKRKG